MRKKKWGEGWLLYSVSRWFIYYRQVGGFISRNNPRELLTTNAYALVTRMAEKNDIKNWGGGKEMVSSRNQTCSIASNVTPRNL